MDNDIYQTANVAYDLARQNRQEVSDLAYVQMKLEKETQHIASTANAAYTLTSAINNSIASKIHTAECRGRTVDCDIDPDFAFYAMPAMCKAYEKALKKRKAASLKARQEMNKYCDSLIRDVKFDKGWTIIKWLNGDVTRVRCADEDEFTRTGGFNAAVAKHFFGNAYNKIMHKWCD